MTVEQITAVVTIIVTYICGKLSKKFDWVTKDFIPLQNLAIGFFAGLIAFMAGINDNPITSICLCVLSAFATGGAYDLGKCGEEGGEEIDK